MSRPSCRSPRRRRENVRGGLVEGGAVAVAVAVVMVDIVGLMLM